MRQNWCLISCIASLVEPVFWSFLYTWAFYNNSSLFPPPGGPCELLSLDRIVNTATAQYGCPLSIYGRTPAPHHLGCTALLANSILIIKAPNFSKKYLMYIELCIWNNKHLKRHLKIIKMIYSILDYYSYNSALKSLLKCLWLLYIYYKPIYRFLGAAFAATDICNALVQLIYVSDAN